MWLAISMANFGGIIQLTGASWLMSEITNSREWVALVQASTALPIVLFALFAGAIADNFPRRRVLYVAYSIIISASLALLITTTFFTITPKGLLLFTFLIASGSSLSVPSWQASIGDILPRHEVPHAVLLNNISFNTARALGPALAGVIIALAGGCNATFGVNALSYMPLLFVLAQWKPPQQNRTLPREKILSAAATGIRYVAMSPSLCKVLLKTMLFGIGSIAILALLPIVARELLHGGPREYGILLGAFGAGAVAGAGFNTLLKRHFSLETISRLSFVGMAVTLAGIGTSRIVWITAPLLLIGGATWVLSFSNYNSILQLSSPRWVVGRVLSNYQVFVSGGFVIGSYCWGRLADYSGLTSGLLGASLFLLAMGLVCSRFPIENPGQLNLTPHGNWEEPPLPSFLTRNSGPIVISIEFHVKDENIPSFLHAVERLRQIRLRNGAKNWSLTRDIHECHRWIISYQFATWTEYVRHNHRTTKDDAAAVISLWALHTGTEPPKVTRLVERQSDWKPETPPPATNYPS